MPINSAPSASRRLLSLLSLLQVRRDWPGELLADRLGVTSRTVRRDIDRLRELGYPVRTIKGPDGGYRLDAGAHLPPLLFDDEQAVALAVALRSAALVGAGIEEAAARALSTVTQLMPNRLRARLDALDTAIVKRPEDGDPDADIEVLIAIGAAIRSREELRFDYRSPSESESESESGSGSGSGSGDGALVPPRRVHPHHLLAQSGRWYLLAWDPAREDWRIYRADRMTPRIPTGPRFTPREVPGGDPATFLAARFKGSNGPNTWPCQGEVILAGPATEVIPFVHDGIVEPIDTNTCRVHLGAWSWPALAATLARWDMDITAVNPPELRQAFADLAHRAARAADGHQ